MLSFFLGVVITLLVVWILHATRPAPAPKPPGFGLHVSAVKGIAAMSDTRKEPITLSNAECAVLALNPNVTDDGGQPIPASDFTWASSNPDVIAVVETHTTRDGELIEPGPYGRVATTPVTGEADVVVTHVPSGNTETQPIVVVASAPGSFGLGVSRVVRD